MSIKSVGWVENWCWDRLRAILHFFDDIDDTFPSFFEMSDYFIAVIDFEKL